MTARSRFTLVVSQDRGMADIETAPPPPGRTPSGLTRARGGPALLLVLAILVVGTGLYAVLHQDVPRASHRATVDRAGASSAPVHVVGGVDRLRIMAGDAGDDLLVADTSETARSVPA